MWRKNKLRSNDNFKFLIAGAGRGGTSLLAGLLDYHSELEVGFELYSVAYLMGEQLPYQGPELFHQRATAFISACKRHANNHPDVLWGNKITTEQIFGLEDHNLANPESRIDVLDMFFNVYLKNISIIFILRDGRTCIKSKVERTGQPIETARERWQFSVKCYKFFQTGHANNISVRFEDVLLDPKTTLTNICDFLKIPYQENMLNGTRNEKMLREYQSSKLDISKTKSMDLPDACIAKIKDDLSYCGYS
ncbi:MAG: sulfotransferase [Deltaproteobacteria bacterium]|nr:sulfotransferase [Deltaproteobacteria bacterium]